jgi:hypothetical protein
MPGEIKGVINVTSLWLLVSIDVYNFDVYHSRGDSRGKYQFVDSKPVNDYKLFRFVWEPSRSTKCEV